MSQISFPDAECAGKRKKTRRDVFLEEMEQVVPKKALLKVIEPHYPTAGRWRRPHALEAMLRVHLMQNGFALSDSAMEEALYEIASPLNFPGLTLSEPIPGETTILSFGHMLEESDLAEESSSRSMRTCRARAFCSSEAASSTRRSSRPPVPRRTPRAKATRRCTRPRRATRGTSA